MGESVDLSWRSHTEDQLSTLSVLPPSTFGVATYQPEEAACPCKVPA